MPSRPPRARRSHLWIWLVAGGAAAVALIVVLALVAVTVVRNEAKLQEAADTTTVSMPPKAGGLVRSTDREVVATVQKAVATMRTDGLANAQGAGYGKTQSGPVQAIALGSSTPVRRPEAELKSAFRSFRKSGTPATGVAAYPPGPLGGFLQCAELDRPVTGSLCGWADHGSLVLVIVPARTPDQAAVLVLRLRADIEHRRR